MRVPEGRAAAALAVVVACAFGAGAVAGFEFAQPPDGTRAAVAAQDAPTAPVPDAPQDTPAPAPDAPGPFALCAGSGVAAASCLRADHTVTYAALNRRHAVRACVRFATAWSLDIANDAGANVYADFSSDTANGPSSRCYDAQATLDAGSRPDIPDGAYTITGTVDGAPFAYHLTVAP